MAAAADAALGLRFARRELRGGVAGFRVFLACLALGVGAIAAVGSLSETVTRGLAEQGRVLLGGDVELRLSMRAADAGERAYLENAGRLSETVVMHAMAAPAGEADTRTALVHLKAVDDAYPLFGAVELDPAMPLAAALAVRDGLPGAVAEPVLMHQLGVEIGDRVRVGERTFALRAAIENEPDRVTSGVVFGPRLMIAASALDETGLLRPGSLVRHYYRLALPPEADVAAWVERLGAELPDAGWRIRDARNPQPTVKRFVDRLVVFLTLVGLATLLIGGLGVGGAVKAYLDGRTETIATLKCLGASGDLIFRVYLAEVLALAAVGVAIGLVLGALAPAAAAWFVDQRIPGAAALGLYPRPLIAAAAFGLLTALAFALWPLARAREVPAAGLFRDLVARASRRPRWPVAALIGAAAAALAALAFAVVADKTLALWFIAGAPAALLLLRAAAWGVARMARALPRSRRTAPRLALANLHRPGAPTAGTMMALGLGLTLVTAVGLVEGNVGRLIEARIAADAPAFYFIDIQPGQVAAFERAVTGVPAVERVERMPHLRGRITHLDGVPVEDAEVAHDAAWITASDRGITYAAEPPPDARIVAGAWWPADYDGPPLVSLGAEAADGLGLAVGDSLTVNVLGRTVEARIANLRAIDWSTLGINFVLVFVPGVFEAAPQTHIATVHAPPAAEDDVLRAVGAAFPNVSAVAVRQVLESVARLLADIGAGARAAAGLTLAASALVVGGAVAAGQRRRVYDAVVLKVLGATRRDVARAYLFEFAVLGAVTALAGAALGTAAGWLVVTRLMDTAWTFLAGRVAADLAICLAIALVIGFAGTWRALGRKPAPVLRHE